MAFDYEEFKEFCTNYLTGKDWTKMNPIMGVSADLVAGLFDKFEKQKTPPPYRTPVFVKIKNAEPSTREVLRFSKGGFHNCEGNVLQVAANGALDGPFELASEWRLLTQEEKDLFNA